MTRARNQQYDGALMIGSARQFVEAKKRVAQQGGG
jgi:hypothetical protein